MTYWLTSKAVMKLDPLRITRTSRFKKNYQTRIQSEQLRLAVAEALRLFVEAPDAPTLRNHMLSGSMHGLAAFSVTDDIRIVYLATKKCVILLDIGTHQEVYQR